MEKLKVEVTQDDIDRGVRHEPSECAIARAVGRAAMSDGRINVGVSWVYCDAYLSWANLPKTARTFVERFDSGDDVKPFSFELEFGK